MSSMFDKAHRSVTAQLVGRANISDGELVIAANALPPNYSIRQLADGLILPPISSQSERIARVAVLECCLQCRERLKLEDGDPIALQKLLSWLTEVIKPNGACFLEADSDEAQSKEIVTAVSEWKFASALALKSMGLLKTYDLIRGEITNSAVLLSLLAFTRPTDIWNSTETHEIAMETLNRYSQDVLSEVFIINYVLEGFIRPLFSKSRPDTITTQGRKAPNGNVVNQRLKQSSDLDPAMKPWKYRDIHAATVFSWAVGAADESLISQNWHLFVPPLMTLIDDTTTSVRATGLALLSKFLRKTSPKMLVQTGLGDVLEAAVMPSLLFLPSLTPVKDSLVLLKEAYDALFVLGDLRYPLKDDRLKRNKFFDRVMREGVIYGFANCQETASIMELLFGEMGKIINRLSIYSIKHLKDIIPLVSAVMMDPFAPSNPAFLLQGIKATQTTILHCWPTLSEEKYRVQLLRAFSVCWINVSEEIRNGTMRELEFKALKSELKVAASLLVKSAETVDMRTELATLINVHPDLSDLFEPESRELVSI